MIKNLDTSINMEIPDDNLVIQTLINLKENGYVLEEEAVALLNYVVYMTRQSINDLGIDVEKNSLDGFCELTQSLSIRAFEKLGFKVTKNLARIDFDYYGNHSFGTVTIPIKDGDTINNKVYLIDVTYCGFFIDNIMEEYSVNLIPYIEKQNVVETIIKNGYIELNNEIATLYGKPFSLISNESYDIDYYNNIINSNCDYSLSFDDMEGLTIEFPDYKVKKKTAFYE